MAKPARGLTAGRMMYFWMGEIAQQCTFANYAYQQLGELLATVEPSPGGAGAIVTQAFYHIHAFLSHVGSVAQFINSQENPHAEVRRRTLRQELTPILVLDRTFRNHLTHYDERMVRWLQGSRGGAVIDMNISAARHFGAFDATNFFRNFDPETTTLYMQGQEYHLPPIAAEIAQIEARANAWMALRDMDGNPLPPK